MSELYFHINNIVSFSAIFDMLAWFDFKFRICYLFQF